MGGYVGCGLCFRLWCLSSGDGEADRNASSSSMQDLDVRLVRHCCAGQGSSERWRDTVKKERMGVFEFIDSWMDGLMFCLVGCVWVWLDWDGMAE